MRAPGSDPPGRAGRLLLAVQTASEVPSAAVLRGERVLGEALGERGRAHAESLLPAVEAALGAAGRHLDEVEAFAIAIGPGSFTGLRVGLATVKGLAFAGDRPVAPVSTLAALAHAAGASEEPVATLLDARRGEVYAAVFAAPAGAAPRALLAEGVYTPDELAGRLPARCLVVGAGARAHAERLRDGAGPGMRLGPVAEELPRASHVGVLGARRLARGEGVSAQDVVPRYLRRAEAEVRRTGQRLEPGAERPESTFEARDGPLISRS